MYNIIQPQTIQIDGQEAIYLQGGQQAIQISGNQILSPSQAQSLVRQGASNAQAQQGQQVYIQGLGNAMLSNGQQVMMRQGNVMQALQLPAQQTIPVQTISTQNGQTILQTIQFPIQALQSLGTNMQQQIATQVMPQIQQVQMTPIQVSQASGQQAIKQEPTDSTTQITVCLQTCLFCVFILILLFFFAGKRFQFNKCQFWSNSSCQYSTSKWSNWSANISRSHCLACH